MYCVASDCSLLRTPKQASIRVTSRIHVPMVMDKPTQAAASANDALLAPGTPPKQPQAVASRQHRSRSPSPVRKPWVSAEWKHRVPKSSDKTSSPTYLQQLQTEHRVSDSSILSFTTLCTPVGCSRPGRLEHGTQRSLTTTVLLMLQAELETQHKKQLAAGGLKLP